MKVRKRVTLMVIAVSAVFGICWGTSSIIYVLQYDVLTLHNGGPVALAIADTMVLFNSAINPFVYALVNQQFRKKIKRMICGTGSLAPRVHPTRELQTIELSDNTTHPT